MGSGRGERAVEVVRDRWVHTLLVSLIKVGVWRRGRRRLRAAYL